MSEGLGRTRCLVGHVSPQQSSLLHGRILCFAMSLHKLDSDYFCDGHCIADQHVSHIIPHVVRLYGLFDCDALAHTLGVNSNIPQVMCTAFARHGRSPVEFDRRVGCPRNTERVAHRLGFC